MRTLQIIISLPVILIAFLVPLNCMALGPLPDGRYDGTLKCWMETQTFPDEKTDITVSDNELIWSATTGGQTQTDGKKFTFEKNGFFTFASNEGKGEGYCGSKSCHYSAVITGLSGEDTFTVLDGGEIYMVGSASDGAHVAICEALYRK